MRTCESYVTEKAEGTEPFRCTKAYSHWGDCTLVQATSGKERTLRAPRYCSGGRFSFIQTA